MLFHLYFHLFVRGSRLKLQLATALAWPPPDGDEPPHQSVLARALAAEDQGFEGVWLMDGAVDGETGVGPSLHLAAAWLASRTERLMIGLRVTLPPSLHPLRLAEELTTLDLLSHGRLAWAVCPGSGRLDVTREQLEIVEMAWSGDRFSYAGEFFEVPELQCLPGPAQQPGPPLWIAPRATSDGATLEWAARGRRPLWLQVDGPVEELRAGLAGQDLEASQAPDTRAPLLVCSLRVPDDDAARACRDELLALSDELGLERLVCCLEAQPSDDDGLEAAQDRLARLVVPDIV